MSVLAKEIEATYEVLAQLGEGGMGAVYKVRHRFFDEIRVIKVMQSGLEATEELKERFLGEARRGKQLRHPNLAEIFDFSIASDGTAYIVMEYIEGINLRQLLTRNNGPLDYRIALPIAEQVLDALGFLHSRKFVHRDISPDNVMLTEENGAQRVKLIDLGIAKSLESTRHLTQVGKFIGKVQYASPEQFGGDVDARSDIYSFGLVLYEMLTNIKPISGNDHYAIITGHLTKPPKPFAETDPGQHVPQPVREAVMKALEKDPSKRFASAAEFAAALRAALQPYEQRTLPEVTVTRPEVPVPVERTQVDELPRSPRRWIGVATILALLALISVLVVIWMQTRTPVVVPPTTTETSTVASTTTVTVEPPTQGQLLINAYPWGQVTSVTDAKGAEKLNGTAETPLVLSLPVGAYKVTLTNPNSNRSVVLNANVNADVTTRAEAVLDKVDTNAYVEGLGIGRSQ